MPHPDPIPVTPEDLVAYADGEVAPDVAARIAADPIVRDEAAAYARVQGRVQRHLYRFACPSPQEIGEYALDLAPPEERSRLAAHIHGCPRCADELRSVRVFLAQEPPPPFARFRRTVATLLAAPLAPAARLRGPGDPDTVRYRSSDVNISLQHSSSGRDIALVGFAWRDEGDIALAGGVVTLTGTGGATRTTPMDELGNFAFDDLPADTYTLEVTLGDDVVAIENLRLDPR